MAYKKKNARIINQTDINTSSNERSSRILKVNERRWIEHVNHHHGITYCRWDTAVATTGATAALLAAVIGGSKRYAATGR